MSLTGEVASMRKNIEELHISVNEKDAEIIKLRMHLGDEKAKANQRLRPASSTNSLVNQSGIASNTKNPNNQNASTRLKSQETSPNPPLKFKSRANHETYQPAQRDQQQLIDNERALKTEAAEMQQNHLNEIKTLQSRMSA